MRTLTPQILTLRNATAFSSPSWCDNVRLLDPTPAPCGQSRETARRSEPIGRRRSARPCGPHGYIVIVDKGFAGADFELGAIFRRPDRKGEEPKFGGLGSIRRWIESVFDTLKGQLSLEQHGAVTMRGQLTRIAQRLLALAAGLWHDWIPAPRHRLRPLKGK